MSINRQYWSIMVNNPCFSRCMLNTIDGPSEQVEDYLCDPEDMLLGARNSQLPCPEDCVLSDWGAWSPCPLVRMRDYYTLTMLFLHTVLYFCNRGRRSSDCEYFFKQFCLLFFLFLFLFCLALFHFHSEITCPCHLHFRALSRHSCPKRFTVKRFTVIHNSYIHSYTDGVGCHARCQPAHQEHFGVQYRAQGHFNMQTR